jgi:predicted RNase H-like HicB family nuclease
MPTGVDPAITLTRDDGWWIAKDTETGVTSQGKTRTKALENLDDALAGYHGAGEEPSNDELRDMGIDPEHNQSGSRDDSSVFE